VGKLLASLLLPALLAGAVPRSGAPLGATRPDTPTVSAQIEEPPRTTSPLGAAVEPAPPAYAALRDAIVSRARGFRAIAGSRPAAGGTGWTTETYSGPDPAGVSCVSGSSFCMAIDANPENEPDLYAYVTTTGTAWTAYALPAGLTSVEAVSCPSTEDCWVTARDEGAVIASTSDGGHTWTTTQPPSWYGTGDMTSSAGPIDCPTTSTCYALAFTPSDNEPSLAILNDGSWQVVNPVPSDVELTGISCATATYCTLVGGEILSTSNGGRSWTKRWGGSGVGGFSGAAAVSCPTVDDCWAVGGTTVVDTDDDWETVGGGSLGSLGTTLNGGLQSVDCIGTVPQATRCWAIGETMPGYNMAIATVDGGLSWFRQAMLQTSGVIYGEQVSCTSLVDCWAAAGNDMWDTTNAGGVETFVSGTSGVALPAAPALGQPTYVAASVTITGQGATYGQPAPYATGTVSFSVNGKTLSFCSAVPLVYYQYDDASIAFCGVVFNDAGQYQFSMSWSGTEAAAGSRTSLGMTAHKPGYRFVAADGGIFCFQAGYQGSIPGLGVKTESVVGIGSDFGTGGYWVADASPPAVYLFDAPLYGSPQGYTVTAPISGFAGYPYGGGFWLVGRDGNVYSFGASGYWGRVTGVRSSSPVVAMAATPNGGGYWLVESDGAVYGFGDAGKGNPAISGVDDIVGIAITDYGNGYWLVGRDGGVFTFGAAKYYGSEGGAKLTKPIVGMAADPETGGYWLVGGDGGIFAFHAPYLGGTGGVHLNQPIVGMATA
jgi:hypothetical protein